MGEKIGKTKDAVALLSSLGCQEELDKVNASRKARGGVAKLRNRKYTMRRGPLVIYAKDEGIVRAFRNIPGVDTACVDRLNLLFGTRWIFWPTCYLDRVCFQEA